MTSDSIQTEYRRRTGKAIPVQLDNNSVHAHIDVRRKANGKYFDAPASDIHDGNIGDMPASRSTRRANVCTVIRISATTCVSRPLIQQISKGLLGNILNDIIDPTKVFLEKFG